MKNKLWNLRLKSRFQSRSKGTATFSRRFLIILFLVVSLLIVHCSFCFAARPLYTEDAWVTPISELYVESGLLLLTNRDNTGVRELITSLKYGFARNFDASLDLPYASQYSSEGNYDGMSNGTFKIKYNFYDAGEEGAGFLLGYQVDSEDQNRSTAPSSHDITTMLIYSKELDNFLCHLNFGYMFDDKPGGQPPEDFILYNATLVKPVTDIMNVMGEVQYSRNTYTLDIVGEAAIGINYRYNDNLTFDTALGCGLNENSSSSNFVFGLTYLIL